MVEHHPADVEVNRNARNDSNHHSFGPIVWTYILRRLLLMIPTLFGVTLVSFCIMQLAPGDPLLANPGGSGAASSSSQHEAYLLQKRELKLDKPLLLNFRYYHDYTP